MSSKKTARGGTPAVRLLAERGVAHTLHSYDHDPSSPSYGLEAATALDVEPERVFKTLVADVDAALVVGLVVGLVPVSSQLDLKALAAAVGGKRASLADAKRAELKTGYVVGGISPIAQRRRLPTVLDQSAAALTTVFVSAGKRGLEIELSPLDLVALTGATVARIASP
jgi:Cys-tRNA(Pro)/Cys-tRNA(Cys) deacylase